MSKIAIIDSGGANIASVRFALDRLGAESVLTDDHEVIRSAERVILPGVGAARNAMDRLHEKGLVRLVPELEQPVLGICLGMQLLCEGSEEDDTECLGIIPGTARKLTASANLPVPNMGWCETELSGHPIQNQIASGSYFYYVHSYALPVSEFTIATARHDDNFSAMVAKDNFMAAQFHPERSSTAGASLLANFLAI